MEAALLERRAAGMTVRVPTTIEMKSDTWWVGPRPSKSGLLRQIAAMATTGMVRPMLAISEP
ncbi:hypothetical protein EAO75_14185 [Streptomyces sp. uw30]|nr:hypothetical protein EAO75_14185 [Streptomyces sp. uw30]